MKSHLSNYVHIKDSVYQRQIGFGQIFCKKHFKLIDNANDNQGKNIVIVNYGNCFCE